MSADKLIFPKTFQQIIVSYFSKNFEMYKRFSDRCHFIYCKFSCVWKSQYSCFQMFYFFYCLKISVFDKSYMHNFYIAIYVFKMTNFMWLWVDILRSNNFMNLYSTPSHKVVMKDDNWCHQNLLNLLMCFLALVFKLGWLQVSSISHLLCVF